MNVSLGGERLGDRGERESYTAPAPLGNAVESKALRAKQKPKIGGTTMNDEVVLVMPNAETESKTELVWVNKEFAETIKKLGALEASTAQIKRMYADIKTTEEVELEDINASYDRLKSAIDGRNEMLRKATEYDYEQWESVQKQFGSYHSKIKDRMKEMADYIDDINRKMERINPYKIVSLMEAIDKFNAMSERDKELMRKLLEVSGG